MLRVLPVCLFLLLSAAAVLAAERREFTILHTNDLHGKMRPFRYTGTAAYAGEDKGGLARLATAIARERLATTHALAVIDCGDAFIRIPLLAYAGSRQVDVMGAMGYDLFCVGNEEFRLTLGTDTQARLLALMRRSRFPWLAANLTVGDTGVAVEGMHPFIVRNYDGVRVGFLGLTAPRAGAYRQTRGWRIDDPLSAARRWAPVARQECDILIAVTHLGLALDRKLAATVPGIDAIVGGDSHSFLQEPLLVQNPAGTDVPIVQAGEGGVVLGRCDLSFEHTDSWRLVKATEHLIPIDKEIPDDPVVQALLADK